jgi:hypothetical protein
MGNEQHLNNLNRPNSQFYERIEISRGDLSELLAQDEFSDRLAEEIPPIFSDSNSVHPIAHNRHRRNATILNPNDIQRFQQQISVSVSPGIYI